jgi:hypothetical protein
MKRTMLFLTLLSGSLFAQTDAKQQLELKQFAENFHAGATATGTITFDHIVTGSPYSATVVNESVQTLADGNRIVQKTSGTTARDSEGRTRNDASLPMIGNMSSAGTPHLVFIVDPVTQTSYTLNLDEKTAHVMGPKMSTTAMRPGAEPAGVKVFARTAIASDPFGRMTLAKIELDKEQTQARTEDLGIQVIEGVSAQGIRTTRTVPAGEIGNEKQIDIVTEVWTSADLKSIVMSKRSDPRSGEQTFRLTNIVRSEPEAALFTIPADFKTIDPGAGGKMFFYQPKE